MMEWGNRKREERKKEEKGERMQSGAFGASVRNKK